MLAVVLVVSVAGHRRRHVRLMCRRQLVMMRMWRSKVWLWIVIDGDVGGTMM